MSRPYTRVAVPTEVYLPGGGMVTLPRRTHHHAASASVRTLRARLDAPTDDEQELIDRCRRIESDLAAERDRMAAAEEEAAELEERLARLVAAGDS